MESRVYLQLDPIHLRINSEPAAGAQGDEADRLTPGRGAEPCPLPGFPVGKYGRSRNPGTRGPICPWEGVNSRWGSSLTPGEHSIAFVFSGLF